MRRMGLAAVLSLVLCPLLFAEDILMGGVSPIRGISQFITSGPVTFVDLGRPANANGSLTHAVLRWYGGCGPVFRLKFLRPAAGGALSVIADRGPFASNSTEELW